MRILSGWRAQSRGEHVDAMGTVGAIQMIRQAPRPIVDHDPVLNEKSKTSKRASPQLRDGEKPTGSIPWGQWG